MRIASVCYWGEANRRTGVTEKVGSQVALWRELGAEAGLFVVAPAPPDGEPIEIPGRFFLFRGAADRLRTTRALFAAVREFAPEIVYLRYDLFAPPPVRTLRALPTVLELNSDFRAELRARRRRAVVYERLQAPLLFAGARGAVCVTNELAAGLGRHRRRLAPRVIANGVSFDGVEACAAHEAGPVRLVFLGEAAYWHGADKLLELAEREPAWRFDLVGAELPGVPPNVTCHGYLGEEAYRAILARADVGVGTLALHRLGMNEACPLKVRRYLAHGLPVILGHEDTDFIGADPWFLLRLPNTEENVRANLDRIRSFVERVRGRRVPRAEVEPRLGLAGKERQRLAYLAEVIAQGRKEVGRRRRPPTPNRV